MKELVKLCLGCGKSIEEENLHINYCVKCKARIDKNNKIQSEKRKQKAYERAKNCIEIYTKNNGKTLTPKGFDEISSITSKKIIQSFRGNTWVEILKLFGKDDLLKDYIKEEYLTYLEENNIISIKDFTDKHKYITYQVIRSFGIKELLDYCGLKYTRYEQSDFECNFNNIKNILGHTPLFNEFAELTSISMNAYINKFNFKGKVYDNIVKMYLTEDEYEKYIRERKEYKNKLGKQTCNIGKTILSLEDLEIEFRQVFDKCFQETGIYPSRRLFSKLSKHDDKTYRQKFNMRWIDICKYFNYPSNQRKSIFENYVLKHILQILNEEYESQKTFSWLIGINDSPLFCDGYFPKHNLIIEVDGRQHRKPYSKFGGEKAFKTLQANDEVKNKLIPEYGIKLLRIADNTNWYDVEYLRSRLEEVMKIEFTPLLTAK